MSGGEDQIHRSVLAWVRWVLPDALIWHTPNGGARNAVTGARLKALGTMPGVPDLLVLANGKLIGIEIKTRTGRVSEAQKAFKAQMIEQGGQWILVRSIEDCETGLREIILKLPGTSA